MDIQRWIDLNKPFISLAPAAILALCGWGEARGEGADGIKAVINVVNNRVNRGGWYVSKEITRLASAYHGVIIKPFQFSCVSPGDPNRQKLLDIANDYSGAVSRDGVLAKCLDLSVQLVQGFLDDNTGGATYYHTKQMNPYPKWASSFAKTVEIGNQIFYRES